MLVKLILRNNNRFNISAISYIITRNVSSTIDSKEVHHFKQYSSTWWDEMGDMKSLHSLNKIRVPLIRDGIINSNLSKKETIDTPFPLSGVKLLDVGCGGGLLSEPLCRLGAHVTGIDATKELIDIAKEHLALDKKLKNLTYLYTTVEDFASNKTNESFFDCVVASEIVEHVCDQERFIGECVRCLKPGGSIFLTTINKTTLSKFGAIFLAENVLRIVPEGTHDYDKFLEPHMLQRILEENNCRTKLIHGMFYNYLTASWSWIGDTSVCYALHAQKL